MILTASAERSFTVRQCPALYQYVVLQFGRPCFKFLHQSFFVWSPLAFYPHPPFEFWCEVYPAPGNGLNLAGALVRGLTCSYQRDIPRSYRLRPFVGQGCMLYIADAALGQMHVDSCNGRTGCYPSLMGWGFPIKCRCGRGHRSCYQNIRS